MAGTCASWTILVLSIITCGLSITSLVGCRFVLLVPEFAYYYSGISWSDYPGLGPFKYQVSDSQCESWPDFIIDGVFAAPEKVSRAFGVIAALLAGLSMLIVAVLTFVNTGATKASLWIVVRLFLAFAVVSQLATFAILASDICVDPTSVGLTDTMEYCIPGPIGIVAATNVVLLLVVSIMSCCAKVPEPVCGAYSAGEEAPPKASTVGSVQALDQTVQTVVEVGEDGTKTTTKSVTNPDGSITITKFIEEP